MAKRHFVLKSALTLMLSMLSVSVFAYDIEVDGIYYNVDLSEMTASVTNDGSACYSGNVTIPETITWKNRVFTVSEVELRAFQGCRDLTSISFPHSIKELKYRTFSECSSLEDITIPPSVETIGHYCFEYCYKLSSIKIPKTVLSIGAAVFRNCSSLREVFFEDSETSCSITWDGMDALFEGCEDIELLYIGRNLSSPGPLLSNTEKLKKLTIGTGLYVWNNNYRSNNLEEVVSLIKNPTQLIPSFEDKVYLNATLKVPVGTKGAYLQADGWKNFFTIEEIDGTSDVAPCEAPVIEYIDGKLRVASSSPNAECYYSISVPDMAVDRLAADEIALAATYIISAYAVAPEHTESPISEATLCWLDGRLETNGIQSLVGEKRAVLVTSNGGTVNVSGLQAGEEISLYTLSGIQITTTKASSSSATLEAGCLRGNVAIIKIGNDSIKVQIK